MTDQNVNTPVEDEDFYDDATKSFPSARDLAADGSYERGPVGPGRLVAIWALENGAGKKDGKPYEYTNTVTLVLDDGVDGKYFTDLVGQAPVRLDSFQHSTNGLHSRLKTRVTAKNGKGVPLKYRPMIGRINTQIGKHDKAAYSISPPTDDDRVIAERYKNMIIDINNELEQKDKAASDQAAFE